MFPVNGTHYRRLWAALKKKFPNSSIPDEIQQTVLFTFAHPKRSNTILRQCQKLSVKHGGANNG